MSAIISDVVQMKEILKATGFDCPEDMLGKTFSEVAGAGKWYCYKTKTNPLPGIISRRRYQMLIRLT